LETKIETQVKLESIFPLLSDVKKGKEIGEGNFGIVFDGIWKGKEIALKQLKNSNAIESFVKEGVTWLGLRHPNIVRFYGIYKEENIYHFCVEFVGGGPLDSFLRKRRESNQPLPSEQLLRLTISGLEALKYLEQQEIIHRDIAARNFLLTSNLQQLKLSDFGMGRSLIGDEKYHKTATSDDVIPLSWVALEILLKREGEREYTLHSDVWSFGITLWEIFTHCDYKEDPYEDLTSDLQSFVRFLERGKRLPDKSFPFNLYEVMCWCWKAEPTQRPSFHQLSQFLQKHL
jgi:serine/threonine protein kinase